MTNIYPQIVSVFYSLLIIFSFCLKKKIRSIENKLFGLMIAGNFIGLLLDIIAFILVKNACTLLITHFVCKLILIYLLLWIFTMTVYIYVISYKMSYSDRQNEKKKWKKYSNFKKVIISLEIIGCLICLIAPINVITTNNNAYTTGIANTMIYILSAILILFWIVIMLINNKNIKEKKFYPIYAYIILGLFTSILQFNYPGMIIITPVETFITILMYFTIENPDIKMIEQLNIARETAEKANHAKSDFLSSMSHEIRTPLNAIVGLSEDIASHEALPDEIAEEANDIVSASHTLLEIVGNILDINKIESNKMEITEVPYNFREEITELAKINGTRIGEKPIDYQVHLAQDIPYELIGDKIHVKQIVNNLLSNAIKYTDQGSVSFTVKCINQKDICLLIITCQDTGKGIKAEDITKLFNKFERLGVEKTSTAEGTGLGLAITKKLVELMGGTINVQSQYGKGSIFVVQLPQKISQMVELHPKQQEEVEFLKVDDPYQNKRVLIVDDNPLNIKVAKVSLKDFSFQLDECSNGKECIDKIKGGAHYDLILMDIMMPEMSGESTLTELKKIPGFDTPVIALTADAVSGAKERYLQVGFKDYVSKPFTKAIIKEKIDAIFLEKNE